MTDSSPEAPQNPPPFPPFPVAESRHVYSSPWCALRRDEVLLPGGKLQEYHVFEISDAVAVVPVREDGSLVMIGQYRYPHGKTHWEFPAGRIDEGESPIEAAARELEEETGHRAARIVPLPGFYPTNGISAHYAHVFCALNCEPSGSQDLDASEQLTVQVFSESEVNALLDAGMLQDAFTALPFLYYLRWRDAGRL